MCAQSAVLREAVVVVVVVELRNFVPDHVAICVNFPFKVKEQLFEQTFCHLIFPVRGKLIADLNIVNRFLVLVRKHTPEMQRHLFSRCLFP